MNPPPERTDKERLDAYLKTYSRIAKRRPTPEEILEFKRTIDAHSGDFKTAVDEIEKSLEQKLSRLAQVDQLNHMIINYVRRGGQKKDLIKDLKREIKKHPGDFRAAVEAIESTLEKKIEIAEHERIKRYDSYGVKEAFRRPWRIGFSATEDIPVWEKMIPFYENFRDLNYSELFPGPKLVQCGLFIGTLAASFGIVVAPHELIHAGTNILTGGVNQEIVINQYFGGDFWAAILPGVNSRPLPFGLGGYVMPASYGSEMGMLATAIAPYIMTPAGIYLVSEAKRKKKIWPALIGGGILVGHLGALQGDFQFFGRYGAEKTIEAYYRYIKKEELPQNIRDFSPAEQGSIGLSTLLISAGVLSFTYRLSKGIINEFRWWKNPKIKTIKKMAKLGDHEGLEAYVQKEKLREDPYIENKVCSIRNRMYKRLYKGSINKAKSLLDSPQKAKETLDLARTYARAIGIKERDIDILEKRIIIED